MTLPNIETKPFAGKSHRVGYATFRGKPLRYTIHPVKGHAWKWEARPVDAKRGAEWVPSIRTATLAQMSGELYNVELKYPA